MAFWNRATTFIAGGAVARAASDAATPVLEPVRQHAWSRNKLRVLETGTVARMVAQAIVDETEAVGEAGRSGFGENRLQALIHLAQVAPALADARSLRRRKRISTADLHHVYAKEQIEPQFWDDLDVLLGILLSPSEIANAVQQGHMPNDGILPSISASVAPAEGAVAPLTPDGHPPSSVPLTQIDLDPIEQAAGSGTSLDQLKVLANLAGLPPGPESLLAMWNRGLIDEETVDAGIREGHMKTKWAGPFKRFRWAVLSGQEYAEARLRDWVTEEEMYAGGALTGHTKSQMDLFYKNRGRTATPRQIWLAWARKIVGPNYPGQENRASLTDFNDHEEAIRRSNIQPWYAKMLWGIRFNYPSLFQLNRMVEAGAVSSDTAALWASYNLEAPDVIAALTTYWNTLGGGKADTHVAKAQTQLWNTTHTSYKAEEIDVATATAALGSVGVDSASLAPVLALWDAERALIRKQLSPAQIKKAVKNGVTNPATGQPWSEADAITALLARGYDRDDALTLLAE